MRFFFCFLLFFTVVCPVAPARAETPPVYFSVHEVRGTACRTSPVLQRMLAMPRAQWQRPDVRRWTVLWTLPEGYVARTRTVEGSSRLTDSAGKEWIIVDLGAGRVGVISASDHVWEAHGDPPRPDAKGNYGGRTPHIYWEVIDPDPKGLNLRLDPRCPKDPDDIRGTWPTTAVRTWPIVGQVARGTILQAEMSNAGGVHFNRDPDGATWLLVRRGASYAFVRWDSAHVKPVAGPLGP